MGFLTQIWSPGPYNKVKKVALLMEEIAKKPIQL